MQIIFLGLFLKKKNKKIVYTSIYPENNAFELSLWGFVNVCHLDRPCSCTVRLSLSSWRRQKIQPWSSIWPACCCSRPAPSACCMLLDAAFHRSLAPSQDEYPQYVNTLTDTPFTLDRTRTNIWLSSVMRLGTISIHASVKWFCSHPGCLPAPALVGCDWYSSPGWTCTFLLWRVY